MGMFLFLSGMADNPVDENTLQSKSTLFLKMVEFSSWSLTPVSLALLRQFLRLVTCSFGMAPYNRMLSWVVVTPFIPVKVLCTTWWKIPEDALGLNYSLFILCSPSWLWKTAKFLDVSVDTGTW